MLERNLNLLNGRTLLLKMPSRVVVVHQDSGTGKSFILQQICDRQTLYPEEYLDILIINSLSAVDLFLQEFYENKIIIIDRYDYYLRARPELCKKIREVYNRNHFLLFARGYIGVPVRPTDYTEVVYNEELKQFSLFYRFSMLMRDDLKR